MPRPKDKYEREHQRRIDEIQRRIDAIYTEAVKEAATIGVTIDMPMDAEGAFSFDDYPLTEKRVEELLGHLRQQLQTAIVNSVRSSWTLANNKNNELCNVVFGKNVGKLTQEQYRRYYSTNGKALEAFIERKENGLNLSDRVWDYSNLFKREIEMGLDLGIRSGLDAPAMARELKQYLKYPDKLFRRVRDEHGNLHLSKAAADFHPGRGVYRSSYMNARRLAATETNIAYRTADHERMKNLDFVVGIEVHLSNNHTCKGRDGKPHAFTDICDELKGKYPKDFKFTGWHPHCRCYVTSVLKTDEEIAEDTKRILRGEPVDGESENKVEDVPEGYKKWTEKNEERIKEARKKGTLPYFVRDNEEQISGKQTGRLPMGESNSSSEAKRKFDNLQRNKRWRSNDYINKVKQKAEELGIDISSLLDAVEKSDNDKIGNEITIIEKRIKKALDKEQALIAKEEITVKHSIKGLYDEEDFQDVKSVENILTKINDLLPADEKWFQNGNPILSTTDEVGINGKTTGDGKIFLTEKRLEGVKSTLKKIKGNQVSEISEEEADAMCTLWHEIFHNRHIGLDSAGIKYSASERSMELANEWAARHTLNEFYGWLGLEKVPYSKFIANRTSTEYNDMVTNFDRVINILSLDREEVMSSLKNSLFKGEYDKLEHGLYLALFDGGMQNLNGMVVSEEQAKDLLKIVREGKKNKKEITKWLVDNNFIVRK